MPGPVVVFPREMVKPQDHRTYFFNLIERERDIPKGLVTQGMVATGMVAVAVC